MFIQRYRLMEENGADGEFAGSGNEGFDGTELPGDGDGEQADPAVGWLRDITEDDAYDTITRSKQFPDQIQALESRVFGSMGPLNEKLSTLEKSLATRVNFNSEALQEALEKYDPALAKVLGPALQESLNVSPMDENTIAPFINPMQEKMESWVGAQVVLANYDPEEIAGIIPETKDGKWEPSTQRHKDFIDWYNSQGYQRQQDLLQFGAPYVRALKSFERWESDKIKERGKATGAKSERLAGGQQPTSQGRRSKAAGPQTREEALLAGFNEVFEQR